MCHNLVQRIEQRLKRPLNPIAPDNSPFARFRQRKINADARTHSPQIPREDVPNSKRIADRNRIAISILQHRTRGARADKKPAETAQLQNQIFRHAIGEETHILSLRWHGQRNDRDRMRTFLAMGVGFRRGGLKHPPLLFSAQAIDRNRFRDVLKFPRTQGLEAEGRVSPHLLEKRPA